MNVAATACARPPGVAYVRGDQVLDPNIILSIWNSPGSIRMSQWSSASPTRWGATCCWSAKMELVKSYFPASSKERIHRYALDRSGLRSLRATLDQFLAGPA